MTTHTDAARAIAYALNDLLVCTATGGSSTTAILSQLINTDAAASTARYGGNWLYGATGALIGVQRKIADNSYVPGTGQVGVTPGWSAPVSGTVYDLTALFPRAPGILQSDTAYVSLLLAGMRRLNVRREISVAITTATRISLSPWTEWMAPERVLSVREPSPSGRLMSSDWREWRIVDGQAPVLELQRPFAAGAGNLTLEVVTPAYTWIKPSGGAWGESTGGLVLEGDETIASVEHLREAGLVEAYRVLMSRSPARPNGNYADDFQRQQAWCRQNIADYDFGAPPQAAAGAAA